ncbi:MAG: bifunctional nuclease family protein [Vampirovibrio sp.]|jgi:bifunctional DNase/RNase|nr:bifunctional nuclease family protein [Vampirovibrio sp.]
MMMPSFDNDSNHLDPDALIELNVMGIALDTRTGTPIVVLQDVDKRRALPIWIGTAEASAIIRQLEGIESSRPMTHDLMHQLVKQLGYQLVRVEINHMEEDTYYATLIVQNKETDAVIELDSRPSDAVALALRMKKKIYAAPSVMSEGTVSTDNERDEQEAEAFKDFLANIKASDFKFQGDTPSDQ